MLKLIALLARTESMNWPRFWSGVQRYLPTVLIDAVLAAVALALALALRFDGSVEPHYVQTYWIMAPVVVALYAASSLFFQIYRRAWRFASLSDFVLLAKSVALSTAVLFAIDVVYEYEGLRPLPYSVVLLSGGIAFGLLGAMKVQPRLAAERAGAAGKAGRLRRTLIVGAGQVGQLLVRELRSHPERDYLPICFVDDAHSQQGLRIHNVPVRGSVDDIPALVSAYGIDTIVIAMSSISGSAMRRIVDRCHETDARIIVAPGPGQYLQSPTTLHLRELTVEDLLGRRIVEIDVVACRQYLSGRSVLVTGAAGSIGSELCRQLVDLEAGQLVLFDNNETGLHDLALELEKHCQGTATRVIACPGSVTDEARVNAVFLNYQPAVVFHAAAYKHVSLMEQHPGEAVIVNVGGTRHVAEAALRHSVARMVLVSTDKAVHPSSVMGMTKRAAELVVQSLSDLGTTRFCAVRFGNVLGSRGSVVPTFAQQIGWGGPITVTDPDARRFMIAIEEAARLVVQAGSFAEPGGIYILDMGEEVRILDLAIKMIRFRGLRVGDDVPIHFTGLKPGEKMREELVRGDESLASTSHPSILKITSLPLVKRAEFMSVVNELLRLARAQETDALRRGLSAAVQQDYRAVELALPASQPGIPSTGDDTDRPS